MESIEETRNTASQREAKSTRDGGKSPWPFVAAGAIVLLAGVAILNPAGVFDGVLGGGTVATVNGVAIQEVELDERVARVDSSVTAQGGSVQEGEAREELRRQVLTTLVNEELLLQAAAGAGVTAENDEIQGQLDEIRSRFSDENAYRAELSSNNFTDKSFRENVRRQIIIQKYLAERIGEDTVAVTDEEVEAVYNQAAASAEGDVPSLAQVREQLRAQIQQQKLNSALQPVIAELRNAAEIEVFI